MSSNEKCLIAAKKDNISDTYVLVQNLNATIQKILANDTSITEMRVLGFQLSDEDAQAIAYAMTETKILKALSLDHLHLGDSGAKHIAQGLCYNESITYLSLRWNEIGPEGGIALAEAFHYNKHVRTFVGSFNNFGTAGAKSFAAAIQKNTNLETLNLKWNNINDEAGDMLLDALGGNKGSLSTLLLGGNGSGLRNARKSALPKKDTNRSKSMRFLSMRKNKTEVDTTVSLDQLRKDLTTVPIEEEPEEEVEEEHEWEEGDLVECIGGIGEPTRVGRIRFIGGTEFQKDGIWVGVEFEQAVGKNNGTVNGVQYFSCLPNHGSFLRPDKLRFISR